MGIAIQVDQTNFSTEVLERSQQQLVLVDFYAQWCGPCQLLKPILEKLTQEYDFALAKVDIDVSPELATTYRVSGVPDVRIAQRGELQPGFVGALAEPQLRELLGKHGLQSHLDLELARIQTEHAAGNLEVAKQGFGRLIEKYPDQPKLMLAAATFLVQIGSYESAQKILTHIPDTDRVLYQQAEAVRGLLTLKQQLAQLPQETDLDRQYATAIAQFCQANYEPALAGLLNLVETNRKYNNDAARKAMLLIFELLGNDHALTRDYRKRLTLALY